MNIHKFKKISIYFNFKSDYWRLSDKSSLKISTKTGPFFLNLKDRLDDNHYDLFDDDGLPIRMVNGIKSYNYTTLCSYALANWHLYLESGDENFLVFGNKTLKYINNHGKETSYGGFVLPYNKILSAMNQGEALSLIARFYEVYQDPEQLILAERILKAYRVPVNSYGVLGTFAEKQIHWYEERAELPAKHILNGMIYSLIGVYDFLKVLPDNQQAKTIFNEGVNWLKLALPQFDTGFWSWYWLNEVDSNYIASMMYHNLHICQLQHLYNETKVEIFNEYAIKFDNYRKSMINRMKAGVLLVYGKSKMR